MDAETSGLMIGSSAFGALCALVGNWVKAHYGQKKSISPDPSPFPVQQQGPYMTCAECSEHRKAINARIDEIGPALNRIFKKLNENDSRSEQRAMDMHRRLDPFVEKLADTAGKVEMIQKIAEASTIGGHK